MKTHLARSQLFTIVHRATLLAVIGSTSLARGAWDGASSDVSAHDAKAATGQPLISGPLRASKNPNYFEDASGTPLILCGSHSWNTLQDWGTDGVVRPLDFGAFVTFLKRHRHN